jgi:hypothetical protein
MRYILNLLPVQIFLFPEKSRSLNDGIKKTGSKKKNGLTQQICDGCY